MTHILETLGDKLAPVETREMMALADEDGDGNINYEEFISMLFKVWYDKIYCQNPNHNLNTTQYNHN